jgi:hypothetical protein
MTLTIPFPPDVAIMEKLRVVLASSPRCVVTGFVDTDDDDDDDDDIIIWL